MKREIKLHPIEIGSEVDVLLHHLVGAELDDNLFNDDDISRASELMKIFANHVLDEKINRRIV